MLVDQLFFLLKTKLISLDLITKDQVQPHLKKCVLALDGMKMRQGMKAQMTSTAESVWVEATLAHGVLVISLVAASQQPVLTAKQDLSSM
jgi:hypothetical protein